LNWRHVTAQILLQYFIQQLIGGPAVGKFRVVAIEIFDASESATFGKNRVFGNIDAQRVGTVGF
jgi:hypothetical protein